MIWKIFDRRFAFSDPEKTMTKSVKEQIEHLSEFALHERVRLLRCRLEQRTRYLAVCLENIYQSQNASAVLRTCDAFGVQDVHVVEHLHEYRINPDVSLGSEKWITLNRYSEPSDKVVERLRGNGYRIIATCPSENGVSLNEFDLAAGKCVLIFGTELTGLSDEVLSRADEFLYIPMRGFVESLNISVSAAIILHELTSRLRELNLAWQLSDEERDMLMLHWLKLSVRSSRHILERFFALR